MIRMHDRDWVPALIVCVLIAGTACTPTTRPPVAKKNNGRLVSYPDFYLINQGPWWELHFDRKSQIWLKFPDGSVEHVPDIDAATADRLLAMAVDGGDKMATKSRSVSSESGGYYDFWAWSLKFYFDEEGQVKGSVVGKSTDWDGKSFTVDHRVLPGGVHVGRQEEGPFHDLVVTDMTRLIEVFGEPKKLVHYEPHGP